MEQMHRSLSQAEWSSITPQQNRTSWLIYSATKSIRWKLIIRPHKISVRFFSKFLLFDFEKLFICSAVHPQQAQPQDALAKFLQQQQLNNHQQNVPLQPNFQQHHLHQQRNNQQPPLTFPLPIELQQQPEVQAMMRDVASGLLSQPQVNVVF